MFGHRKMTHAGHAAVVASQTITTSYEKTERQYRVKRHDLVLDVAPDGGSPFRAETFEWFNVSYAPRVGDVINVRCNPEAKTVEVDIANDGRFNLALIDAAKAIGRADERQRLAEERQRLLDEGNAGRS